MVSGVRDGVSEFDNLPNPSVISTATILYGRKVWSISHSSRFVPKSRGSSLTRKRTFAPSEVEMSARENSS